MLAQQATGLSVSVSQLYPLIILGIVMIALSGIVQFVRGLTEIWDRTRRKPPAEMTFATKEEIRAIEDRSRSELKAMNDIGERRSKENRDLLQEKMAAMEKWIGEKIADNRTSNSEQFGEIRGELHALRGTMQALSNDLFRSVGRMEGAKDNGN